MAMVPRFPDGSRKLLLPIVAEVAALRRRTMGLAAHRLHWVRVGD